MVVHCLEIVTDTNYPTNSAVSDLQTYRQNHSEVLEAQASDLSTRDNPQPHYHAMLRFAWSEALQTLRDDAEAWLNANFNWWAWRYHECDHDETATSGCAWDAQNSSGNVPADIVARYT